MGIIKQKAELESHNERGSMIEERKGTRRCESHCIYTSTIATIAPYAPQLHRGGDCTRSFVVRSFVAVGIIGPTR